MAFVLWNNLQNSPHDFPYTRLDINSFIEQAEPYFSGIASPTTNILRGSPSIGRKRAVALDTEWAMEFDVTDAPYYSVPQQAVGEKSAARRNLYYWQSAMTFEGTGREMMLCSAPLVDSAGEVFGVCGFEVSDRLFKLNYMPVTQIFNGATCVLAPMDRKVLSLSQGFFAGWYVEENRQHRQSGSDLQGLFQSGGFFTYAQPDGERYAGLHRPVRLYPKDSPFSDWKFVMAFIVPQKEVDAMVSAAGRKLFLLSLVFLILGTASSLYFSKWYTRPILRGLRTVRDVPHSNEFSPTRIPEIDDLIEFLRQRNGEDAGEPETPPDEDAQVENGGEEYSGDFFDEFIENTKTLSRAEKNVFNLYLEGHSAQDIAQILNLSINTIKSHNRRIFKKLKVSSRKELFSYVQTLQKEGRVIP